MAQFLREAEIVNNLRAAAGVIPIRADQVYLVQRSSRGSFFPGYHAFPGGAREPSDASDEACAVRELFEETGGWPGPRAPGDDLRRDLLEKRVTFEELVERFPFEESRLVPAGLRVTPDYSVIRFSARFYLWQSEGELSVWPGELESGRWWGIQEAYSAWEASRIFLAPPTQTALARLLHLPFAEAAAQLEADPQHLIDYIPVCPGLGYVPLVTPTLPPARHTMCFLVGDVLVDPGSSEPEQLERLERVLHERQIVPRAVLFTHHHPDHVGGLQWARNKGYPVWGHPRTGEILGGMESVPAVLETDAGRVEILHTPGHASGHVCLWLPERAILIAADLVSSLSTILVHLPDGNMRQYLDSLRRCRELQAALVLPSHGGPMGPGSDLLGRTLNHRLEREEKVVAALATGATSVDELLLLAYADTPRELWPIARLSLEAHLEKLR